MNKIVIGLLSCVLSISAFAQDKNAKSSLNIGGDMMMRYIQYEKAKIGTATQASGFQFYELELFLDSVINKNVSFFGEVDLFHEGSPDLEKTWIDFHYEDAPAYAGNTGIMLGHFAPYLGYYSDDDEEGWITGGRVTGAVPLVRNTSVDGMKVRDRDIGIQGNYKYGPLVLTAQVFNGNGKLTTASKAKDADNDNRKVVLGRIQFNIPGEMGMVAAAYQKLPKTYGKTVAATTTGIEIPRDIERMAASFKYPNVPHGAHPDLSLGDKPFTIFGEYIAEKHYGNPAATGSLKNTLKTEGWWVEGNARLISNKLLGILRFEYYDPDTSLSKDYQTAVIPAIKYEIFPMTFLTFEYDYYNGGKNAALSVKDSDRIYTQISVLF